MWIKNIMYWLIDRLPKRKLEICDREFDFFGVKCKAKVFDRRDLYQVVMHASDGAIIVIDNDTSILVRRGFGDEDRTRERLI
jgi:hypothetical protein